MNEVAGILVGPHDGKVLTNPIGGRMKVKLRDEDTAGAYSIHDNIIPAGSPGPLPYFHRNHEEIFYVLEGELRVRVGARTITAPQGSFVVIPGASSTSPRTPQTSRRGSFSSSPRGDGPLFRGGRRGKDARMPLQMVPTDPEVKERLRAFTEKYGYEFAEFPPGA